MDGSDLLAETPDAGGGEAHPSVFVWGRNLFSPCQISSVGFFLGSWSDLVW
jgi:hypothetical protein